MSKLVESNDSNGVLLRNKDAILSFLGTVFFALLAFMVCFPFLAMIFASFRPGRELIRYGLAINLGDWENMTLANYEYLFGGQHQYFIWFKNSLILTLIQVVLTLIMTYFVAYGLAMYRFKFRGLLFFLVIATMMVPFEILMLPLYTLIIELGLINTRAGIILPGLVGASTIFFFYQFMQTLPKDLLAAARIDGANEYRISVSVMLPICKPAFAAMAILSAMGSWNNMLWPMLVIRDSFNFTLPIGLNSLLTPYGNNYDLLIAGSVFSVIPVFIVFLMFQKYFIEGLVSGSIKG